MSVPILLLIKQEKKKHRCEEGEGHLRISFWYLLMNLKNNYLQKTCLSDPIRKKTITIFTMLHFFFKKK